MPAFPHTACCAVVLALGAMGLCRPAAAAGETEFMKAALARGDLKAFVALVSRAGLADTLGASPVTAFVPTDAAFARLSPAQRESIADLSPEGVRDFVGRFVFPGTAMASNDVDKTITSENGTVFDVTWYVGRLSLRDHRGPATGRLAYVVQGDIPAGPGVIDAVDSVLMPAGSSAAPNASATPSTPAPPPTSAAAAAPSAPASAILARPAVPAPTSAPVLAAPAPGASGPAAPSPNAGAATQTPTMPSDPPPAAPREAAASPDLAPQSSAPASPATPMISVAAAGLRGWPLKVSGNGSTGKVNGVLIGLPDGRVTGLSAHFGGFLGFGGRNVYVPWDRVAPDAKAHVLRVRMTAAEFAAAPAVPPKR